MELTRRQFIASAAAGLSALAVGGPAALGDGGPGKYSGEELGTMKEELVRRMKAFGAYDVRIADPAWGFEHGLPESDPLAIWPECRAILVAIVPNPPDFTFIPEWERNPEDIRKIANNVSPGNTRINTINHLVPPIMGKALPAGGRYLMSRGFQVEMGTGPKRRRRGRKKEELQYKMCAYEAGIGVYGRSGFILHPELGNRICIMPLMTDAPLPPDGRIEMETGCHDCGECVKACPAGSYDLEKAYPESYSMRTCARNRNELLMKEGTLCQCCFAACKSPKKSDEELLRWLKDAGAEVERKAKASPEGRIRSKVDRFHRAFRKWREAGGDPAPVVRIMKQFGPMMKKGRFDEAEALIDRAMEIFEKR
jgi:epoxyqueuosine reductase QueG